MSPEQTEAAVSKLISLTNSRAVRWSSLDPFPVDLEANDYERFPTAYGATWRTQKGLSHLTYRLRLYERHFKQSFALDAAFVFARFEIPKGVNWYWSKSFVLQIVDSRGAPLWTFPSDAAVPDLWEAVSAQVSDADRLIQLLASEEPNSP